MKLTFADIKKQFPELIITGGGSGGHIFTAIAVIRALEKKGFDINKMLFVGGNLLPASDPKGKSIEQQLLEDTDIPFIAIRAGKLQRTISLQNIKLLLKAIGGIIDSIKLFKYISKPKLILSFGGYVTLPVGLIGTKLFKIPLIIHEQTASIGLTNTILAKFADKVLINFKTSKAIFKRHTKAPIIHTGNPIQPSVFKTTPPNTKLAIQLKKLKITAQNTKLPVLFITGGGQGSKDFNEIVLQNMKNMLQKYIIILQCGSNKKYNYYKKLKTKISQLSHKLQKRMVVTEFVKEELGYVYKISDIVLSRGGAGTITHLGILKKKSVIVPIPWVTHNEQMKNAKILEKANIAIILEEKDFTYPNLTHSLQNALKLKPQKVNFPTNAASKIADIVIKYLHEH